MTASWQLLFICSGQYHWPWNLPPLINLLKPSGCHIIPSFVMKACADMCNICSVYSSFILKEDLHCGSSKKPCIMGKIYRISHHILSRSEKRGACESDLCKIQLCNIKVTYMFIISSRTRRLKTCHHPNYFETLQQGIKFEIYLFCA